ncbi:hypothetical protein V8C37DRAFT_396360 [Trichoderma ceciliae]
MRPTESLGWIGFQALKVRFAGRLTAFSKPRADLDRPTKYQNDIDLLESDLRDIFQTETLDVEISDHDFDILDRTAHDFLLSLNGMVNEDFIDEGTDFKTSHKESHDIIKIGNIYPKLAALMFSVDKSASKQLNLVSNANSSVFILPHGDIGNQVMCQVTDWRMILQRLVAMSGESQCSYGIPQLQTRLGEVKLAQHQASLAQNFVGFIMDAIFKEFQQANCGMTHQVKLRVLDEKYTFSNRPKLEMLLSCCQSGADWQEAVCDSIQ